MKPAEPGLAAHPQIPFRIFEQRPDQAPHPTIGLIGVPDEVLSVLVHPEQSSAGADPQQPVTILEYPVELHRRRAVGAIPG